MSALALIPRGAVMALALMGLGACFQEGQAMADNSLVIAHGVYRATATLPDPCYEVSDEAQVTEEGDTVTILRSTDRDPSAICAAVLTDVEVTGPLPPIGSGIRTVTLILATDDGRALFSASAPL